MFRLRIPEKEPVGIDINKDSKFQLYRRKRLEGRWWRVKPINAKEVLALAMLAHRQEKFAPEEGGGVLVSDEALSKFKLSPAIKTNRKKNEGQEI
jgi:hypothetical protein